jgi:hypothetical protein
MEPKRGMVVRDVTAGGQVVSAGSPVWIAGARGERLELEFRSKRFLVAADDVVEAPVPAPTLEALRRLDSCFGLPSSGFELLLADSVNMCEVVRCKAHGQVFLRDTRGDVAMYERVSILTSGEADDWVVVWNRYHQMSDDWLNWNGRTL